MSPKVLLYSSTPRTAEGGVAGVYRRLASHLAAAGFDVTAGWAEPAADDDGQQWVCPLEYRVEQPLPILLWRGFGGIARLLAGLLRLRPSAVNIHYVRGDSLYFALLKPLLRFKLVLSFHGSDGLAPTPLARRVMPFLFARADAVTVVSRDLQRALMIHGCPAAKIHLIPNGIDTRYWARGAAGPPADPARLPHVVAVGHLVPVKGHEVLLAACARLRRGRHRALRVSIIGDGGQRAALLAQAADSGLGDALSLPGHLPAAQVRACLNTATVFAMPSRSEGMPLALLEAMAAGLPVVATHVGGIPEVVTPPCGRLVAPDDVDALAAAIDALLSAPALAAAAGAAAAQRAGGFCEHAMAVRYESVLRPLAGCAAATIEQRSSRSGAGS